MEVHRARRGIDFYPNKVGRNHVEEFTPPVLDGSDASAKFLIQRFPDSIPKSKIELPPDAVALIQQYATANEQLEKINEQKQEAENLLKQMLGDHEAGTISNHLITWKSVAQERLDSKTLKTEHPTLYRKYAAKSSYRRFSIKAAS